MPLPQQMIERKPAWPAAEQTGGLAVAAMTATVMSLFHELNATIMVLIWNLGVAAMIVSIGYILALRARAHS
jgi:hypothetical protein